MMQVQPQWVARGRTPVYDTILDKAVLHGPVVLCLAMVAGAVYVSARKLGIFDKK
jgi:hypothetical protein